MSAMTLVGPRVTAAMAADGVLPKVLQPVEGRPPLVGLLVQAALAVTVVVVHDLRSALNSVGAILTLFAALTVAGLFVARVRAKSEAERPAVAALAAAGLYVVSAAVMLYYGFRDKPGPALWLGAISLGALGAWFATRQWQRRSA